MINKIIILECVITSYGIVSVEISHCEKFSGCDKAITANGYSFRGGYLSIPIDKVLSLDELNATNKFPSINSTEYNKIAEVVVKYKLEKFLKSI